MNNIDIRIQALEAELATLKKQKEAKFPIITTVYVHGSEDSMYDKAKELGLSKEAAYNFSGTAYELGLKIEVSEDGKAKLLAVDGVPLERPTEI